MIEPASHLLPQSGRMAMISRIVEYGDNWLSAESDIDEQHIFVEEGQLPAWAAIEIMAQTIAALAGVRAQALGEPVKTGFLLGTRKFNAIQASFAVPCILRSEIEEAMIDANGFGVYACRLLNQQNMLLAEANINVFCPPNIQDFIGESS
ncbi:Uncharacterised protein [Suttonella ornithocola]|uniref:(3R)-hydroxymyristoyl-ACP dehydratase n=2 Tax=Suttonella ornithocola TaxID=279832 RepID=A0A380MZ86_9GAMM|nr:Uncharacterised protein [Suttonella ornithocola]